MCVSRAMGGALGAGPRGGNATRPRLRLDVPNASVLPGMVCRIVSHHTTIPAMPERRLHRGSVRLALLLGMLAGVLAGARAQAPATFALLTPPPNGVGRCDARLTPRDTPHAHWRSQHLLIVSPDSAWRREIHVDVDTTGGFTSMQDYISHRSGREGGTIDQVRVLLSPDGKVGGGRVHHVTHVPPGDWQPGAPAPNIWPQPSPLTPDEVVRARALAAWLRKRCGG